MPDTGKKVTITLLWMHIDNGWRHPSMYILLTAAVWLQKLALYFKLLFQIGVARSKNPIKNLYHSDVKANGVKQMVLFIWGAKSHPGPPSVTSEAT